MSSMLHSMNVVREVPVRLLKRSTVKISQKRTIPITTQLFSDQWLSGCSGYERMWLTYAAPSAKHEMTASFSVLRIWSFQTDLIGSAKTNKSVRTFVAISALRTKIWSMQCPMRSSDHCCFMGLHRKIKMKVKTMAQMMTIAMPARIQFLMWIAKTRM